MYDDFLFLSVVTICLGVGIRSARPLILGLPSYTVWFIIAFMVGHFIMWLIFEIKKHNMMNKSSGKVLLTLRTLHWFYWTKLCLLSHISNILTTISRIIEPIPGMFVLIWMHFSWWFQIWSRNPTMLTFFTKFI